jgi:NitT/TauT family transport system substrate-binding protein
MNRIVQVFAIMTTIIVFMIAALIYSGPAVNDKPKDKKPVSGMERLRIAFSPEPLSIPVAVAYSKDFFKDEGLDVSLQKYAAGKAGVNAVIGKRADMTCAPDAIVAQAILKGARLRAVAVVGSSELSHSIIARRDKGILKPGDLRGKKIGVTSGTSGEFDAYVLLTSRRLPVQEIQHLKPEEMEAALIQGRVDAVSTWEPYSINLKEKLGASAIEFLNSPPVITSGIVVVRQELTKRNPSIIEKSLRALLKAEAFIREKPDEARDAAAPLMGMERAMLDKIWDHYHFKVTLDQDLIVRLEELAVWLAGSATPPISGMPNFLDYVYVKGLKAAAPDEVTIVHRKSQ